jgi:RimJ/RimL family protein N-acetyltransferase
MKFVPYSEADRELTIALESSPAVMGHLGGAVTPEGADKVHRRWLARVARGDLVYAIVPDGETAPIGITAIWRTEWNSQEIHELGAMALPDWQRRGLASQGFEELLRLAGANGITRLHSFPAVDNVGSNALMGKLGFTRIEDCDLEYGGRPLRCAHWVRELTR